MRRNPSSVLVNVASCNHMYRVEGVFCRIRQKLEKYRLDPVVASINDHISNSKVSNAIYNAYNIREVILF